MLVLYERFGEERLASRTLRLITEVGLFDLFEPTRAYVAATAAVQIAIFDDTPLAGSFGY